MNLKVLVCYAYINVNKTIKPFWFFVHSKIYVYILYHNTLNLIFKDKNTKFQSCLDRSFGCIKGSQKVFQKRNKKYSYGLITSLNSSGWLYK